jgi:predicted Rdx family selenoprotein
MARKKFTKNEMEVLKSSTYVLNVTPSIVHFSVAFKGKFWQMIMQGITPREAVIELGIDPDVLGETRLSGLKTMIRNEVRKGGFRDIETYTEYIKDYANPEVKVKHLEQVLAYKNQEIEFLKKIVSLGREGTES